MVDIALGGDEERLLEFLLPLFYHDIVNFLHKSRVRNSRTLRSLISIKIILISGVIFTTIAIQ